jgi:diadenosine tetraphosphatase ApaH/serine/threonine PP2A family protein phosphatase
MKAILSDIHGNLEALRAVLEDIDRQPVEAIYCLGDVVGYGPDPCACLDLAMTWGVVLRGNHDDAAVYGDEDFNPVAQQALQWTRGQLEEPVPSPEAAVRRWDFLAVRPVCHTEGDAQFVHASPRDPLYEYVLPVDANDERVMRALFGRVQRLCFQGHTHIPGVFAEVRGFISPEEAGHAYHLGEGKALINVGSVGQPRDGDWRACYALFDGETIRFRRVEYDVDATALKILKASGLPASLADRLFRGE